MVENHEAYNLSVIAANKIAQEPEDNKQMKEETIQEVNEMLSMDERKTLERLATVMQSMDDMQKAQLCAFAEGMALMVETSRAS